MQHVDKWHPFHTIVLDPTRVQRLKRAWSVKRPIEINSKKVITVGTMGTAKTLYPRHTRGGMSRNAVAQWASRSPKCAKTLFGEWKFFKVFCMHMKENILDNNWLKYFWLKMTKSILKIAFKLNFRSNFDQNYEENC